MELVIREVRPDDAAGVARILNSAIETGRQTVFDTPFTVAAEREYIQGLPARAVFMVAEQRPAGEILGFQSMEPFATYTGAFDHVGVIGTYVDHGCRRQGIGKRLAEASFAAAQRQGYEKILTYVRSDNPNSLSFYLNLGFRVVGTAQKQAKIGDQYVDEIIIEKFL